MHKLTVRRESAVWEIAFQPGAKLSDVLIEHDIRVQMPCGGNGRCGKCRAQITGNVSAPNAQEARVGFRLICQAVLLGDAEVALPSDRKMQNIETAGTVDVALDPMGSQYGAAVDIGTTTLALTLYDLKTGACLSRAAQLNPQTAVSADVMGRIGAAMDGNGDLLRDQVTCAIRDMLKRACEDAGIQDDQLDALTVTGNTTMLYLLTGKNPVKLSRAPFDADCLFDEQVSWEGKRTYLPPCMHAFVGADISCAVLASGMTDRDEIGLLMDVGTNGEIALWKDGTLYISSTAAGPAFEGAGISCGCGSVQGAIDRVWIEEGKPMASTIGGAPASGVCGSGLIDAIAVLYELGEIDETGATESDEMTLDNGVSLIPADVRAVQLAKAAIAAGLETLMKSAGVRVEDVARLYIAGGFGSHLNIESAVKIGLIPGALEDRVQVIGNAALTGAATILKNRASIEAVRRIASCARHVDLGGNPSFNEAYMEHMFFPND